MTKFPGVKNFVVDIFHKYVILILVIFNKWGHAQQFQLLGKTRKCVLNHFLGGDIMAVVYNAQATVFKEATVAGTTIKPMIPYPDSTSSESTSTISSFVSGVINNNIAAIPDTGSIVIVITGKEVEET